MNDYDFNSEGAENIEQEKAVDKAESVRMELHDWLQCIVLAVVSGIFIFVFIGRTIGVKGESMLPTFHPNDRVVMSNLFYTPRGGDLVIFHSHGDFPYVKRVIAVAGQTVDIDFMRGVVYVDGVALYEPYILEPTTRAVHFHAPVTVPEGYVFVLGDNRNNSTDSRDSSIGFVDTRQILGRVLFILIPGSDGITARDWSRIGPIRS